MSDLFHKDVPDSFILQVFETMAKLAPWHTYQVLTKRPSRLVNTTLLSQILDRIGGAWPRHIWLGTSVESRELAWRVDMLRRVPASVRFISAEPLLGPITLDLSGIHWVIVGAESGRGARPMDEQWVRLLRDQCVQAGVAFFLKQYAVNGRKLPLPLLDGRQWAQFPNEQHASRLQVKEPAEVAEVQSNGAKQ
jgi:protein gp37